MTCRSEQRGGPKILSQNVVFLCATAGWPGDGRALSYSLGGKQRVAFTSQGITGVSWRVDRLADWLASQMVGWVVGQSPT